MTTVLNLFDLSEVAPLAPMAMPQTSIDFNRMIYGNGGNRPAVIKFYEDSGHGWLKVPKHMIKELGLTDKISRYSYKDKNSVYLEEDCDLSIFLNAIGISYTDDVKIKIFWECCPRNESDYSHIRNMAPFGK